MKHLFVLFILLVHLVATMLSPALCANEVSAQPQFRVFIDELRALRVEGTDESDTIIATVASDPTPSPKPEAPPTIKTGRANIEIEYSSTNLVSRPQKLSFSLDAFDRIVLNAGRGDDFVNIIDALELLDSSKKLLNLNGGDGDNVVVLSHVPFRRETVGPFKRLTQLSLELEAIAKRATDATSAALTNDAMKAIEAARINLAEVSKSIASDTDKQVMNMANQLVEDTGSQVTTLGNSLITRSDELAKRQEEFANDLTKTYDPTNGVYLPDDNSERGDVPDDKSAVVPRDPGPTPLEKAADLGQTRAELLSQAGVNLGTEARDQLHRSGKQMERNAATIEQQATEIEKRALQLSATADTLALQEEKGLTAASQRIRAVITELKSLHQEFQEAAMAMREEVLLADSLTVTAKNTKLAATKATSCNTPIVAAHTYNGGGNSDFFFPFSAPSQSWTINGGGGADFLFGGFADDDINGGAGVDVICGLKGNDHIRGDAGTDFLFGEFIIDFPFLTGGDCIWGGDGVDLVVGDNLIDTPVGTLGGDDKLWGDKGTDIIIGDDVINAPNFPSFSPILLEIFSQTHAGGADTIEGNADMDLLFGGGGADTIHGNQEMDFAEGNGDGDKIYGDDGRDIQFCNTTVHLGNFLMGGDDDDEVHGGKGIDVIFGNDGPDKLFGADQIDVMFGGADGDEMHGDAGGQICSINNVPVRLGNLMFGNDKDDRMWAGGDLDIMFGQDGDDKIYGYDGSGQQPFGIDADLLFGGAGDDYMEGDNEPVFPVNSVDFMFGGDDQDEMHGGSQPDFMHGGRGKDKMHGDSNSLLRVASVDLMFGGPDEDWMDGGNGLDVMLGQEANDTMLGDDESPGEISSDVMFGGPGSDTMNGGCTSDFMLGSDGDDRVLGDSNYWWEPLSSDLLFGNAGNDFMDGGNANDLMFGGPDCDTMLGDNNTPWRITHDFMFGESGNDIMDGGNSTDFMFAGEGHDKMFGDQEFWWQLLSIDWMWGDDGCDAMLGGTSLDWMWGGPDVDQMDGQRGADMMFGGANTDHMNGGAGLDFIWGNNGNDVVHGDAFIDFLWGGDGDDCVYGDDGQDLVWGNSGEDCLHGGSHADILFGNDGHDLIFGDSGPDILNGNAGDDRLDGGAAGDILVGGPGSDELWGGPGFDWMFGETRHQQGNSGLDCDCRLETCTGRICVRKFNDLNGDGIQNNSETGLPNWTFQIGATCAGGTLVTDGQGNACGDFFPGTYSAVEQIQSGWTPTTPTTQPVTVSAGSTATVTFGNKRAGKGELCIFKFNDANGNGLRDTGEVLVPNWSFTVTDSTGATTTLTTHQGGGVCRGFPVGPFTVTEVLQPAWTATTAITQTVSVPMNQAANLYFGNRRTPPGGTSPTKRP